jgi:phosphoserine phosphatase
MDQAVFYTDSITDLPLLEAVGRPVAVNPDARLRRVARSRGWAIEQWIGAPLAG